jgi:hypothetical protein
MARLFLVLSIAALALSGCASYGDVAKLNRTNQDYLARLDKQLSSDTGVKPLYAKLGSSQAATLRALSRAGFASIEAQSRFSDTGAQQIYLNGELARIQTQFNEEADDDARRAPSCGGSTASSPTPPRRSTRMGRTSSATSISAFSSDCSRTCGAWTARS